MRTTETKIGAAALPSLGLLGGAAAAQSMGEEGPDDAMEVQALMAAKMTPADAIPAAEASGGGRAISAEFDDGGEGEMAGYDVELMASERPISGGVVSASDGSVKPDMDGGDDGEDDDNGRRPR